VSHDAVSVSGTDALSHDGTPGANALWWRVVVLWSLVRDDWRLWLGAGRTSRAT
jgi:hypothetical protein